LFTWESAYFEDSEDKLGDILDNIEGLDMLILSDGNETQGGGIAEVYSPPRIVPIARAKGLVGGWSLDLTSADSQGRVWDFDDLECRRRAEALIDETQPSLLVGSVLCTFFSVMRNLFGPRMAMRRSRRP
jgi:hypothetical protein